MNALADTAPLETGAEPRLALVGVTKRWRRGELPVLSDVDLEIPPATLAVIVGRNGTGKTTLLRIAAGMIEPDTGSVRLDGLVPQRDRRRYHRKIGFLSAGSTGLYARLTVAEHLDYGARLALVPPSERRDRVAEAIAQFELRDIADRRTERTSMGQRQRLRLALALVHRPSLVLLDEPWNSLDAEGIELVNKTVEEFTAAGGSALVCIPTGHEVEDLPRKTVYQLEDGRLEQGERIAS